MKYFTGRSRIFIFILNCMYEIIYAIVYTETLIPCQLTKIKIKFRTACDDGSYDESNKTIEKHLHT